MSFKKLKIWEKAMALAGKVNVLTKLLPKEELYGVTMQMRRAAVSIPSNIAEGSQRTSNKDFANFLSQKQILNVNISIEELHKMLYSFHSKLITYNS